MDTTLFNDANAQTTGTDKKDKNPIDWKKNRKRAAAALAGSVIGLVATGVTKKTDNNLPTLEQLPNPDEASIQTTEEVMDQTEQEEQPTQFEMDYAYAKHNDLEFFEFDGRLYHTYTQNEWDAFSVEDKKEIGMRSKDFFQQAFSTKESEPTDQMPKEEVSSDENIQEDTVVGEDTPEETTEEEVVQEETTEEEIVQEETIQEETTEEEIVQEGTTQEEISENEIIQEEAPENEDIQEEISETTSDTPNEELPEPQIFSVSTLADDTMELDTAINTAREEGAEFVQWHGDIYPAFSQEEFNQMPSLQQDLLQQISDIQRIKSAFVTADNDGHDNTYNSPIITEIKYDFDGDGVGDHVLYVESVHGDTIFVDTTQSGSPNIVLMDTTGDGTFDTQLVAAEDGTVTQLSDTTGDGLFDTIYHKNSEGEWIADAQHIDDNTFGSDIDLHSPDADGILS